MSTITVKYNLSSAARKRIAVETGDEPKREHELVIDLVQLTPDQRAALLDARQKFGIDVSLKTIEAKSYVDSKSPWYESAAEFENMLTPDDVLAHLAKRPAQIAAATAHQATLKNKSNAETIQNARVYLTTPDTENQPGFLVNLNPRIYADADGYDEAVSLIEQVKAEYNLRYRLSQERAAEAEATAAAEKAAKLAAKMEKRIAWANEFGSEHLKRSLAAGYDSSRLYYSERAAVEYPGYELDFTKSLDSKDRSTPSLDALNALDAVKAAHPDAKPEIVWLTNPANVADDCGAENEHIECEAVIVDDDNYPYWLVMVFED